MSENQEHGHNEKGFVPTDPLRAKAHKLVQAAEGTPPEELFNEALRVKIAAERGIVEAYESGKKMSIEATAVELEALRIGLKREIYDFYKVFSEMITKMDAQVCEIVSRVEVAIEKEDKAFRELMIAGAKDTTKPEELQKLQQEEEAARQAAEMALREADRAIDTLNGESKWMLDTGRDLEEACPKHLKEKREKLKQERAKMAMKQAFEQALKETEHHPAAAPPADVPYQTSYSLMQSLFEDGAKEEGATAAAAAAGQTPSKHEHILADATKAKALHMESQPDAHKTRVHKTGVHKTRAQTRNENILLDATMARALEVQTRPDAHKTRAKSDARKTRPKTDARKTQAKSTPRQDKLDVLTSMDSESKRSMKSPEKAGILLDATMAYALQVATRPLGANLSIEMKHKEQFKDLLTSAEEEEEGKEGQKPSREDTNGAKGEKSLNFVPYMELPSAVVGRPPSTPQYGQTKRRSTKALITRSSHPRTVQTGSIKNVEVSGSAKSARSGPETKSKNNGQDELTGLTMEPFVFERGQVTSKGGVQGAYGPAAVPSKGISKGRKLQPYTKRPFTQQLQQPFEPQASSKGIEGWSFGNQSVETKVPWSNAKRAEPGRPTLSLPGDVPVPMSKGPHPYSRSEKGMRLSGTQRPGNIERLSEPGANADQQIGPTKPLWELSKETLAQGLAAAQAHSQQLQLQHGLDVVSKKSQSVHEDGPIKPPWELSKESRAQGWAAPSPQSQHSQQISAVSKQSIAQEGLGKPPWELSKESRAQGWAMPSAHSKQANISTGAAAKSYHQEEPNRPPWELSKESRAQGWAMPSAHSKQPQPSTGVSQQQEVLNKPPWELSKESRALGYAMQSAHSKQPQPSTAVSGKSQHQEEQHPLDVVSKKSPSVHEDGPIKPTWELSKESRALGWVAPSPQSQHPQQISAVSKKSQPQEALGKPPWELSKESRAQGWAMPSAHSKQPDVSTGVSKKSQEQLGQNKPPWELSKESRAQGLAVGYAIPSAHSKQPQISTGVSKQSNAQQGLNKPPWELSKESRALGHAMPSAQSKQPQVSFGKPPWELSRDSRAQGPGMEVVQSIIRSSQQQRPKTGSRASKKLSTPPQLGQNELVSKVSSLGNVTNQGAVSKQPTSIGGLNQESHQSKEPKAWSQVSIEKPEESPTPMDLGRPPWEMPKDNYAAPGTNAGEAPASPPSEEQAGPAKPSWELSKGTISAYVQQEGSSGTRASLDQIRATEIGRTPSIKKNTVSMRASQNVQEAGSSGTRASLDQIKGGEIGKSKTQRISAAPKVGTPMKRSLASKKTPSPSSGSKTSKRKRESSPVPLDSWYRNLAPQSQGARKMSSHPRAYDDLTAGNEEVGLAEATGIQPPSQHGVSVQKLDSWFQRLGENQDVGQEGVAAAQGPSAPQDDSALKLDSWFLRLADNQKFDEDPTTRAFDDVLTAADEPEAAQPIKVQKFGQVSKGAQASTQATNLPESPVADVYFGLVDAPQGTVSDNDLMTSANQMETVNEQPFGEGGTHVTQIQSTPVPPKAIPEQQSKPKSAAPQRSKTQREIPSQDLRRPPDISIGERKGTRKSARTKQKSGKPDTNELAAKLKELIHCPTTKVLKKHEETIEVVSEALIELGLKSKSKANEENKDIKDKPEAKSHKETIEVVTQAMIEMEKEMKNTPNSESSQGGSNEDMPTARDDTLKVPGMDLDQTDPAKLGEATDMLTGLEEGSSQGLGQKNTSEGGMNAQSVSSFKQIDYETTQVSAPASNRSLRSSKKPFQQSDALTSGGSEKSLKNFDLEDSKKSKKSVVEGSKSTGMKTRSQSKKSSASAKPIGLKEDQDKNDDEGDDDPKPWSAVFGGQSKRSANEDMMTGGGQEEEESPKPQEMRDEKVSEKSAKKTGSDAIAVALDQDKTSCCDKKTADCLQNRAIGQHSAEEEGPGNKSTSEKVVGQGSKESQPPTGKKKYSSRRRRKHSTRPTRT